MKILVLAAGFLLALPAAAAAQSATKGPSLPSSSLNTIDGFRSTHRDMVEYRRNAGGTWTQRRERAERLVVLVNSGQCEAARDEALLEGDRIMAARIEEVCQPAAAAAATS